jgi:hypothetical protein
MHHARPLDVLANFADQHLPELTCILDREYAAAPVLVRYSPFGRAYKDRVFDYAKHLEAANRRPLPDAVDALQSLSSQQMRLNGRDRFIQVAAMGLRAPRRTGVFGAEWVERVGWAETRMRCLEAAIAVERFRLSTGRLPQRLDELVPQFLDALPVDPFSQKPVILRMEKGVVWIDGVGADRVHQPADANSDDVRVSVDYNAQE